MANDGEVADFSGRVVFHKAYSRVVDFNRLAYG